MATKNPESDKPTQIVIVGSDSRLESEIELKRDDALHFRAPADGSRRALYGPYLRLPAGHFEIQLTFVIQERTPGQVNIELCHKQGRRQLYLRYCFEWELEAGLIRISYPFEESVEDLEVRLTVPPGFSGSIKQLSFTSI